MTALSIDVYITNRMQNYYKKDQCNSNMDINMVNESQMLLYTLYPNYNT